MSELCDFEFGRGLVAGVALATTIFGVWILLVEWHRHRHQPT